MLKKLLKNKESGFTIVEVLIVLAIAALILLIVFLAVPALERNSRNTGRKEDGGRLATAYENYVSNNQGQLPTVNSTAALGSICKDAGALNQYSDACGNTLGTTPAVGANITAAATYLVNDVQYQPNATGGLTATADVAIFDEDTICDTAGTPGQVVTATTTTDSALLYTLETGSGKWNWSCVDAS